MSRPDRLSVLASSFAARRRPRPSSVMLATLPNMCSPRPNRRTRLTRPGREHAAEEARAALTPSLCKSANANLPRAIPGEHLHKDARHEPAAARRRNRLTTKRPSFQVKNSPRPFHSTSAWNHRTRAGGTRLAAPSSRGRFMPRRRIAHTVFVRLRFGSFSVAFRLCRFCGTMKKRSRL